MKKYSRATEEWAEQWIFCWRCGAFGTWPVSLDVHHVTQGAFRQANNLATTVMLCLRCHRIQEHGDNPATAIGLLGMLILKRRFDFSHYDLAAVCRAMGRSPTAITEEEVNGIDILGTP